MKIKTEICCEAIINAGDVASDLVFINKGKDCAEFFNTFCDNLLRVSEDTDLVQDGFFKNFTDSLNSDAHKMMKLLLDIRQRDCC